MKLLIRIALPALLLVVLAACAGSQEATSETEGASESVPADGIEEEPAEEMSQSQNEDSEEGDGDASAAPEGDDSGSGQDDDANHDAAPDGDDGDHEAGDMDEDSAGDDEEHEDGDMDDDSDGADEAHEDGDMDEGSPEGGELAALPAADVWGESGTGAQTACDNPYLPIRLGSRWTYEADTGPYDWEVTELEGDMDQATAAMVVTIEDLVLNYTWNCVAGEGISSFDLAGQGLSSTFPDMELEVTRGEGAFLTPVGQIVPGHTWESDIEQTMSFTFGEGDAKVDATADLSTHQTNRILSMNPITAAGITVDGIQVEQITDISMLMHMMGTDVKQEMMLSSDIDMGWGVGIMNQIVESDIGPSSATLLSYYIP